MKAAAQMFAKRAVRKVEELTADRLLKSGSINPLMIKALGIRDFETLARFAVYQRLGRSLTTSFGTTIEKIVREIAGGDKGKWWDVVKKTPTENLYMAVKSGPQDMDKDQVEVFARRARTLMRQDPKALPIIAMAYGREAWPIIMSTLRNERLDPMKHVYVGKELYQRLTGKPQHHRTVLTWLDAAAELAVPGSSLGNAIEERVNVIANEFSSRYRDMDELLFSLF